MSPRQRPSGRRRALLLGPGGHSSPRHMMLFVSIHEDWNCDSMTWRAMYDRPYVLQEIHEGGALCRRGAPGGQHHLHGRHLVAGAYTCSLKRST